MSTSLIFFGNERLATGVDTEAPVLTNLIKAGYEVAALVTKQSRARSRSNKPLEVAKIAEANNIPIISSPSVDEIKKYSATLGVLVAYGRIVPQALIAAFPRGIVNIHPSLLPQYRGSTPIEQAILDGQTQTGVSLMSLAPKMDAGPVYISQELALSAVETKQALADKLLGSGGRMLLDNLDGIVNGSLEARPQDESRVSFTRPINKRDGVMDFAKTATRLEREVRAYAGWPKSRATILGHEVIVNKARIAESSDDGSLVQSCSEGYIEILELTAPSGRRMSGADFIRGYAK